jgi:hypothetical protein
MRSNFRGDGTLPMGAPIAKALEIPGERSRSNGVGEVIGVRSRDVQDGL